MAIALFGVGDCFCATNRVKNSNEFNNSSKLVSKVILMSGYKGDIKEAKYKLEWAIKHSKLILKAIVTNNDTTVIAKASQDSDSSSQGWAAVKLRPLQIISGSLPRDSSLILENAQVGSAAKDISKFPLISTDFKNGSIYIFFLSLDDQLTKWCKRDVFGNSGAVPVLSDTVNANSKKP